MHVQSTVRCGAGNGKQETGNGALGSLAWQGTVSLLNYAWGGWSMYMVMWRG